MVTVVCGDVCTVVAACCTPGFTSLPEHKLVKGRRRMSLIFTAMIEVTFVGCVRAILTDPLTAPSPISQPGGGFLSTTDPIFGALCRRHCRKMCPVGARRCMCVKERAVG